MCPGPGRASTDLGRSRSRTSAAVSFKCWFDAWLDEWPVCGFLLDCCCRRCCFLSFGEKRQRARRCSWVEEGAERSTGGGVDAS